MDQFWQFVGSFWWLIFPLGGVIGGGIKGLQEWDERRRRDKIELARIKYGQATQAPPAPRPAAFGRITDADVQRLLAEHDEVRRRWLSYELNVAKLIDYPMMSDMREPLTVEFHRARRNADGLRPANPKDLRDADRFVAYRTAVQDLAVAFDVAEREARRRRTSDFTDTEREVLGRAKHLIALAEDRGASREERQTAYRRAMRELEGLIVVPEEATEALEQRIAGQLPGAPGARSPENDERGGRETPHA
ncbi:hypothetical protein ATJ97_2223 [Georgenia soli]|uniref:Uncharacterized protein n=1 Tax=Georgenia soli TaxID=638953 RepID=A0A2A9EN97_9MICO|nr:hypothetical protein [Georgenia soli]PFG39710.1 hypothetical protein ATJ97_2223 [Georgenia soli]